MKVRDAEAADNDALVALAASCPMEGDVGLCIDRAPDFFALTRLEGEQVRVGVVDGPDGLPVGCISVARRRVYVDGDETDVMYVSDLKVHPAHRNGMVGARLILWSTATCSDMGSPEWPMLATILAGNAAMEGLLRHRGLGFSRFATLRSHSIPLIGRRRLPSAELEVTSATSSDIPGMVDLWEQVAPGRQFAHVHNTDTFASWIDAAPGLQIEDFLVARDSAGSIVGFLGIWDQTQFKQTRVVSYSRQLQLFRAAFNAVAPLMRATRLPPAGGALQNLSAVNVCVPADRPEALRSLVVTAYNAYRNRGYSFFSLGLDVEDPLAPAVKGFLAQPTDVWGCVATVGGERYGFRSAARPFHHEIALV